MGSSMSDKNLSIVVQFAGQDKLTGILQLLTGQSAKAKDNLKALNTAIRSEKNELSDLKKKISDVGVPTKQMLEDQARLEGQISETTAKIKSQRDAMGQMAKAHAQSAKLREKGSAMMAGGGGAVVAGAALAAPIAYATKEAMTLESAFADVRKVLDFPKDSMTALNNDILDMSTRVPIAAEGLAQIAAAAGRAGVGQDLLKAGKFTEARSELMAFTESAAKMGVAFDISADQAGETMATWRAAFGLNQSGVTALGDQINTLTNSFGGNAAMVTEMITRVGPLGRIAGVAAPQMAAMAQVMNQVGVQSEIGSTGLKNMMLALTKGAAATKEQRTAFASLGLDAVKMSERMQTDAGGAILDIMTKISKLPKSMQAGVLTQLFGSESVAAISPLLGNLEQLKTNFGLVGDNSKYAGSMTREFLARIATTEGATGLAANSLHAVNIELGNNMLPILTAVSNAVTPVANAFRKWSSEHPQLSKALTLFTAVSATLLIGLGALGVAAGAATFAFGALGITTTAALWPVLAVIAGVAALVAVVALVIQYWDPLVAGFSAFGSVIGQAFKPAIDGAIAVFNVLKTVIMDFTPLGWFLQAFNPVFDWLKKLDWNTIGKNMIQGIIDGVFLMLGPLGGVFKKAANAGINAFKQKAEIKSPSRVMMRMGGHITEGLRLGIANNAPDVFKQARALAAGVTVAGTMAAAPMVTPALAMPAMAQGAGTSQIQAQNQGNFFIAPDIFKQARAHAAGVTVSGGMASPSQPTGPLGIFPPAPALTAPKPVAQGAGNSQGQGFGSVYIAPGALVINTTPNQSASDIANEVMRLIEQNMRAKARTSYKDD